MEMTEPQKYLRSILHYNMVTGIFTKVEDGSEVGRETYVGGNRIYIKITIDGKSYYAHRLAFLWMTGYWPANRVDHKDDNGLNNAWNNLRDATHSENMANMSREKRGVRKHGKRFQARLSYYGKYMSLGCYDTYEEAEKAYKAGLEKYYGEFSTFNREVA